MTPLEKQTQWAEHYRQVVYSALQEGSLEQLKGAIELLETSSEALAHVVSRTLKPFAFWAVAGCLASFDGEPQADGVRPPRLKRLACLKYLVQKAQNDTPMGRYLASGFAYETELVDGLHLSHWAVLFQSKETLKILNTSGLVPQISLFGLPHPGVVALQEKQWELARLTLSCEVVQRITADVDQPSPLEEALRHQAPEDLVAKVMQNMTSAQLQAVLPRLLENQRSDPDPSEASRARCTWLEKQVLLHSSLEEAEPEPLLQRGAKHRL